MDNGFINDTNAVNIHLLNTNTVSIHLYNDSNTVSIHLYDDTNTVSIHLYNNTNTVNIHLCNDTDTLSIHLKSIPTHSLINFSIFPLWSTKMLFVDQSGVLALIRLLLGWDESGHLHL